MDWLYGRNVVRLALQAGATRRAHRLAVTPPALATLGPVPVGLPVETLSTLKLDELCGSREHQGAALQVDAYRYAEPERLLRGDVVVVLDEVSDPHNLGAVARSALAAGATGLVVPKHRSASVTPAAVKASAGALELLPVAQVTNTVAFLKQAKEAGFWVYGAAAEARTSYLSLDLTGRVVLVFGAEGRGLRPLVARTCDALAAVPIAPQVESLNVSVAAALFLFEARRQTVHDAERAAAAEAASGAPDEARLGVAVPDAPAEGASAHASTRPGRPRRDAGAPQRGRSHAGRGKPKPGPGGSGKPPAHRSGPGGSGKPKPAPGSGGSGPAAPPSAPTSPGKPAPSSRGPGKPRKGRARPGGKGRTRP
jgi:23S rRNA (guanosine2251-2'-O)-methyltransferase